MSVAVISFSIFAASQVGTPGPANMALLATGARFGFKAALPFVAGVALGKQLIIWPIGFGLMELAESVPDVFAALKWISAAYICWLAWKVANLRLSPGSGEHDQPPGFFAGLVVHPLNPKAWAMIVRDSQILSHPRHLPCKLRQPSPSAFWRHRRFFIRSGPMPGTGSPALWLASPRKYI